MLRNTVSNRYFSTRKLYNHRGRREHKGKRPNIINLTKWLTPLGEKGGSCLSLRHGGHGEKGKERSL
jgi:hypothetical protein